MKIMKRLAASRRERRKEARNFASPWGFVGRMYHASRMHRQRRRIEAFEQELAKKHGPIPPEVKAWGERIEWPK